MTMGSRTSTRGWARLLQATLLPFLCAALLGSLIFRAGSSAGLHRESVVRAPSRATLEQQRSEALAAAAAQGSGGGDLGAAAGGEGQGTPAGGGAAASLPAPGDLPPLFLFIGILSGRGYRHRRLAVREAWATKAQIPGQVVAKFILSEDERTPQVGWTVERLAGRGGRHAGRHCACLGPSQLSGHAGIECSSWLACWMHAPAALAAALAAACSRSSLPAPLCRAAAPQVEKELEQYGDIVFVREKTNYKSILYKTYYVCLRGGLGALPGAAPAGGGCAGRRAAAHAHPSHPAPPRPPVQVMEYATTHYDAAFVLKTDDDAFINVGPLVQQLRALCENKGCRGERVYMGNMAKHSEVLLQPGHKWNNAVFYNHTGAHPRTPGAQRGRGRALEAGRVPTGGSRLCAFPAAAACRPRPPPPRCLPAARRAEAVPQLYDGRRVRDWRPGGARAGGHPLPHAPQVHAH